MTSADLPLHAGEALQLDLARELVGEVSPPLYVVGIEDSRVEQALHEVYFDPYIHESFIHRIGRRLLTKSGLTTPKKPIIREDPYLETSQAQAREGIHNELDRTRDKLRRTILNTVDEQVIDTYIGVRTDDPDSILPSTLKIAHRQAENTAGESITFSRWMADYASDEELLNVWQWHKDYLNSRDNDPEFIARIQNVKAGYLVGLEAAIAAGEIDPAMRMTTEQIDSIRIQHSSPFSPITAYAHAHADTTLRSIRLRHATNDFSIYHEIAHLRGGGLGRLHEEGAAELIATIIYNYSHSAEEQIDPTNSVYTPLVQSLASIERLTEGNMNLRQISAISAGPSERQNFLVFATQVDTFIELALVDTITQSSMKDFAELSETQGASKAIHFTQRSMLDSLRFMEAVLLDEQGHLRRESLEEIFSRVVAVASAKHVSPKIVSDAFVMILREGELRKNLSSQ